jgi:5-hydroxyisourate hydrolase-like protein (transthyretin family)
MRIINSFLFVFLIFISLSVLNCETETESESDFPRTIHIEGVVTYQSDGSPAEKVTVQIWRWENDWDDWDDDFNEILATGYIYSIATDYTNEEGEYKIVYNLKDDEHCRGNGFCNIRAYKVGYIHENWPALGVHCTEDIQIINFQLY